MQCNLFKNWLPDKQVLSVIYTYHSCTFSPLGGVQFGKAPFGEHIGTGSQEEFQLVKQVWLGVGAREEQPQHLPAALLAQSGNMLNTHDEKHFMSQNAPQ